MQHTTGGIRQRADNPRRMLYPAHAIIRCPESHTQYACLCGQRGAMSELRKHVLIHTQAA